MVIEHQHIMGMSIRYVSGALSNIRLATSSQEGPTLKIKLSDKVIFDYSYSIEEEGHCRVKEASE